MKTNIITCDLCQGEMYDEHGSGHGLHIRLKASVKRIWWWMRKPDNVNFAEDKSKPIAFMKAFLTYVESIK